MDEYDSDMSGEEAPEAVRRQKSPFLYDYYLSNSIDVFENWKITQQQLLDVPEHQRAFRYIELEFPIVTQIEKFRTADIIRAKAFIHMLKKAFEETSASFAELYNPKTYISSSDKPSTILRISKQSKHLQQRLQSLLNYLEIAVDQDLQVYYNDEQSDEKTFQQYIFEIISKLYTYVGDLRLLWDTSGSEILLVDGSNHHSTSLGGNSSYYKNILRSLLKRNWQLKELYDRLIPELNKERVESYPHSPFLTKVICQVIILQRVSEKDKGEFIECMKGLYFLGIDLRGKDLYYKYMLTGFHLEVLSTQKMFKDFEELEEMYIEVLQRCKKQKIVLPLSYTIEMDKLPFEKRKRIPEIEQLILEIVYNYIAVAKSILAEKKLFSSVAPLPEESAFASTQELLKNQNFNGLVGILMLIQQNSKDAFSYGDIQVHKVYLQLSELIKEIYLSYQHQNWLFAPDMLLYIPLRYFMDISEDIRADVKKTLFIMVESINEDRMPYRLRYNPQTSSMTTQKVARSEYLQVILYFLEECHQQQEYINLPEVIPTNLQTSILYIKSLELKLNEKEPTPDQMPYVQNMLKTCENYKLNIKFKWYRSQESIEDREIQFNIEKGITEDWMRKIYRQTINQREAEQIRSHFENYQHQKGLSILNLANIFKYCHGLNPGNQIQKKAIREQDLFTLLEEIKMLLSINFDIFNLNLDEEISLNYIHVCLSLYNSCYDETPFNQAYLMIMDSIMKPYLASPNSTQTNFRNKYPGFFQKWIYSFQIANIFQELGAYISEKGEDDSHREDIINKIKLVSELIDNKENIKMTMKMQDLTETIVLFSTLISRQSHPLVYIESVELFCLFLNTFPEVSKDVSLDFMLDQSVLADERLACEIVEYIKRGEKEYRRDDVSIVNSMVKNLPQYMDTIGPKRTNELLDHYSNKLNNDFDDILSELEEALFAIPQEKCTLLINTMRIVMVLKKQFEVEKEGKKMDVLMKGKAIEESLKGVMEKKGEGFQFCEMVFLDDILSRIDNKTEDSKRQGNLLMRNIFHELIRRYGNNDDIIYFAQKLDFFDLILIGKKDECDPREEAILLDLLIETKYKGNETELIKKILRQSRKLSDIAPLAVDMLQKQKDKIHCHHLNKFIHINNRYPNAKIEQFIIQNIGGQRNHAAVKIKQTYLIKDLIKKLQKIPKNICEELMLKPIKEEQQEQLIDFSSNIFQTLLYLPIKEFQNVKLQQTGEIPEENEDWNTESEGEQEEETKGQSQRAIQEGEAKNNKEEKEKENQSDQEGQEEFIDDEEDSQHSEDFDQDIDSDGEDYDRPPILQMFYEQGNSKQLQLYSKLMVLREQLDVMIDSKYEELAPGSALLKQKDVCQKIATIANLINAMQPVISCEIVARMPDGLTEALRTFGLVVEIPEELKIKIQKMKKINKKPPKWMLQLFSDREESDDSNIQEDNDDGDDEDQDSYSDIEEEDVEGDGPGLFEDDDSDDDIIEVEVGPRKKKPALPNKKEKSKKKKEQELEIPGLLPSYSKVQQQISGGELKREQLLKILQVSLYWLLHLPESQVRTRQVTSYYMDILQSNLGQIFFQSFMTVIRFDQTKSNLQSFMKEHRESQKKIEIGLQFLSMQDAVNNILYLIKEYQDSNVDKENYSNILFKESGMLLPIAEQMITDFDLPIQNNCLTLLLLYISTNKARIRTKINALDYSLKGNQLDGNRIQYKLKHAETVRVIEKICKSGSSNTIWEIIETRMNLKVSNITKLFSSIKGYGSHLYSKLRQTGQKIMKTIQNSQKQLQIHHPDLQHDKLHNIENMHRIISKLVLSVKDQIKQFYFINKAIIKQLMEEENQDLYEEIQSVKKIPKKLVRNSSKIFNSKELIALVQAVVYFIKILKDQFYGKIQDKLFNKLIHYPKMVIESIWYYIFIFKEHKKYKWSTPSQIDLFFRENRFIGSYKFNNLQEVFGLVIYFFNLESFCTDKFKQFFLPVLMQNSQLSKEIPLMFKIPKTGDDEDLVAQSILVTRKCSFDMAFYQVTGQAIQVEFHEEEGSDHGGLVRELMIGWRGRGVGEEAFFIGKILGISFKQGVPYGGSLDIGTFIAITNYTVTLDFFKEVDPQIYKSLKYIKENDPEPLCLKFMVERLINGKYISYELVQGGKDVDLVEANKQKYLELYMQKYFYMGRERELKELKLGFNTVVYPLYAEIFTPLEMMRQIKGEEIVDVKMLISKARYEGYSAESAVIRWFWELVQTFDQQKMNTFIQFLTGSPKITVYNSNFSITIEKVYDIDCLPVAHTCFNTIDLPEYSTKEILQKKFLTAICEGNNSFGIL